MTDIVRKHLCFQFCKLYDNLTEKQKIHLHPFMWKYHYVPIDALISMAHDYPVCPCNCPLCNIPNTYSQAFNCKILRSRHFNCVNYQIKPLREITEEEIALLLDKIRKIGIEKSYKEPKSPNEIQLFNEIDEIFKQCYLFDQPFKVREHYDYLRCFFTPVFKQYYDSCDINQKTILQLIMYEHHDLDSAHLNLIHQNPDKPIILFHDYDEIPIFTDYENKYPIRHEWDDKTTALCKKAFNKHNYKAVVETILSHKVFFTLK